MAGCPYGVRSRSFFSIPIFKPGTTGDLGAVLRLAGAVMLIALMVGGPTGVAVYLISPASPSTLLAIACVGAAVAAWLGARFAFYLPALAIGDTTSLREAFSLSKPHLATIVGIYIAVGVPAYGANWLVGKLALPPPAGDVVHGGISAFGAIIITASVCQLYAGWVRPTPAVALAEGTP